MEARAIQKYVKVGPRKLRLVADVARKMSPLDAIETLPFMSEMGALTIAKVLKTAVANARVLGLSNEKLKIKTLDINEGPMLKRFRPVSRGRAHGYVRKMSHIRVVLVTDDRLKTTAKKAEPKKTRKETVDSNPKTVNKKK